MFYLFLIFTTLISSFNLSCQPGTIGGALLPPDANTSNDDNDDDDIQSDIDQQSSSHELFNIDYDLDSCECDRIIASDESFIDGSTIDPGGVLCFDASTTEERGVIYFNNIVGTETDPIFIRSCGGTVLITSSDHQAAIKIDGSYFRLSGKQNLDTQGIHLKAPLSPHAISVGKASHFEIDHVEISSSDFAGIMAKVDPSSDDCHINDRRYDDYIMEEVYIHHNTIHDTVGEGIYVGNSFFTGVSNQYCASKAACDLSQCDGIQYPHLVKDIRIFNNTIARVGWDAIQVGSAVEGCFISDNTINDWGMANQSSQNHGIQVGDGSSCWVKDNQLQGGGIGIHLAGIGGSIVSDNSIKDFSVYGIIVNPRPAPLDDDIEGDHYIGGFIIDNNLIISTINTGPAIRDVNVPDNPVPEEGNEIKNNEIETQGEAFQLTGRYGWTHYANDVETAEQ